MDPLQMDTTTVSRTVTEDYVRLLIIQTPLYLSLLKENFTPSTSTIKETSLKRQKSLRSHLEFVFEDRLL